MVRRSFTLPDKLHYKAKRFAKENGMTFSALIREAVNLVIEKYRRK